MAIEYRAEILATSEMLQAHAIREVDAPWTLSLGVLCKLMPRIWRESSDDVKDF
jgi:hypothetical protein